VNRSIQRLFQDNAEDYILRHVDQLSAQHRKVIDAIQSCGTHDAGTLLFTCSECQRHHHMVRSCSNRMCPTCQTSKTAKWLDKRLSEQLPTHYFMLTFTVPEQLRPFMLHQPKLAFDALFKAASTAIKKLALNPRHIGADLPGFFGILHTWGRTMQFHPHIHFVVPGGGIDKATRLWKASRTDFYLPVQALSEIFRGVFQEQMIDQNLIAAIDPCVWRTKWNVNSQAVHGNREGTLKYLASYVFKTAITDSRIVSTANDRVVFCYRKSGSNRQRRISLSAHEFIRRYLMHVLPHGFMRIRYYGFMNPAAGMPHDSLVAAIRLAHTDDIDIPPHAPQPTTLLTCVYCGAILALQRVLPAAATLPQGIPHAAFHKVE